MRSALDQLNADRQRLNSQGTQVATAKANPSQSQQRAIGVPAVTGRQPMKMGGQSKGALMQQRPVFQSRNAPGQRSGGVVGVAGGGPQITPGGGVPGQQATQQPMGGGSMNFAMAAPTSPQQQGRQPAAPDSGQVIDDRLSAIDEALRGSTSASQGEAATIGSSTIGTEPGPADTSTDAVREAMMQAVLEQLAMDTAEQEALFGEQYQGQIDDSVLGARAAAGSLGGYGGAIAAGAMEGDIRRQGALGMQEGIQGIRQDAYDRALQAGELGMDQQGLDFDRELWGEYKAYLDQILLGDGGGGGSGGAPRASTGSDWNRPEDWMSDPLGAAGNFLEDVRFDRAPLASGDVIDIDKAPDGAQEQYTEGGYTYYKAADGKWYRVRVGAAPVDDGSTGQTLQD